MDGLIDRKEHIEFIDKKVQMCKKIYSLIIALCKNNQFNQLYTFDLIPYF